LTFQERKNKWRRQWLNLLRLQSQQQNKAHVPKFGNWDNAGNVPYTVYFENARKGKGGRMINPNDPAENPEAFSSVIAPSPSRSDAGRPPPPTTTPSPPPRHEAPRRGSGGGGRTSGSVGGGYSVEQSPVHPYSYSSGKAGDYSEDGGGFGLVFNSVDRSRGNEAVSKLR
jgi:RPM1-interacting protein 4